MGKPKRNLPVPEMRERLLVNRSGKLTPSQWMDIVIQPLTTLLVLLVPAAVVFWARLAILFRPGLVVVILGIFVLAGMAISRAYRYARLPVHVATLCAKTDSPPFWTFWKPVLLYDESGTLLRFNSRLCPPVIVTGEDCYLVYFLRERQENIVLSIAPAEHPDAAQWQPDKAFERRFSQRNRS